MEQPLGTGSVGDLGLPSDFLSRAADRIVRSDYQRRYPGVAEEAAPAPSTSAGAHGAWAYGVGYAALALLLAAWLALRARKAER